METRLVHYVNRLKKYDSRKYTRISRCGHSVATCRPLLLVHVQFSKWHSWKLPNSTDPRVIVCRNYRSCWQHRRLGCPRSRKIRGLEQDRQCSYSAILRRVRVTAVTAEKQQVLHILCVCVCLSTASVTEHAQRMRRNILSPVACQAPPCFLHIASYTARFSDESHWTSNVWFLSTTFVWRTSHYTRNSARFVKTSSVAIYW